MNKPEPPKMPDPLDVLGAIFVAVVACYALEIVAMMLIDVVAYGMEKLS